MPRGNTILFALVFFYVSYRIIQPWFVEEPKKDKVTNSANSNASSSHEGNNSDRYIAERLAEGMPKLYAWQRLLKLKDSNSDEAYFNYLTEWIGNNPEQLFDKAFSRYQGGKLTQIQTDFLERFTLHFDSQAQPQLDVWFDGEMSRPVKLAICQALAEHHKGLLESWMLEQQNDIQVVSQCIDYLFSKDFDVANNWYQNTHKLKTIDLIDEKYQILSGTETNIN